jgi:hypothetical protein
MRNKLVIHYADGRLLKGWSPDIFPNRPSFHFTDSATEKTSEIRLADLKGVFYVKDYVGHPGQRQRRYDVQRVGLGRRVRVRFSDGEVIEGYTSGYSPGRLAFFLFPPDPDDNTERVLVVTGATTEVVLV